jgi:hypothetical protein
MVIRRPGRPASASAWRRARPGLWSFIKHYVFKRGFLDGWAGFVIAFGNFESTFYRCAKRHEETQDWQPPPARVVGRR